MAHRSRAGFGISKAAGSSVRFAGPMIGILRGMRTDAMWP